MRSAFVTPRWLALHALLVVSVVVFGRIGWWQWAKADAGGDWQNYGYGIQWWLFGVFAVFLYVKQVLDELDPTRVEERVEAAGQRPAVPLQPQAPAPSDEDDDELAAYNRHLAWLAAQARAEQ